MYWDDRYENRWQTIEHIQNWFRLNDRFWLYLNILSFVALFSLEMILTLTSSVNHFARSGADFLAIPLLGLYTFAIFWRSIIQSFLAFAGSLMTYFGIFFVYTPTIVQELSSPSIANKLGVGIKHYATVNPASIAEICFIMGMFTLSLNLAMSLKPKFFEPKKFN